MFIILPQTQGIIQISEFHITIKILGRQYSADYKHCYLYFCKNMTIHRSINSFKSVWDRFWYYMWSGTNMWKTLPVLRGLWRSEQQKRACLPRFWLWLLSAKEGRVFGREGSMPPFRSSSNTKPQRNLKLISYWYSTCHSVLTNTVITVDSHSPESGSGGVIIFILHVENGNPERAEDHESRGSGFGTRVFQCQMERGDLLPGPDGLWSHPVSHHSIILHVSNHEPCSVGCGCQLPPGRQWFHIRVCYLLWGKEVKGPDSGLRYLLGVPWMKKNNNNSDKC